MPGLPPPVQKTNSVAAVKAASGAATNAVAQLDKPDGAPSLALSTPAIQAATSADLDDTDDTDKVPAVDADLVESENIMLDYMSLLPKESPLMIGETR